MGIEITWAKLLLRALVAWTLLGCLGVTLSFVRQERDKAYRHLAWIAGVWILYLSVLLTVSVNAHPHPVGRGQEQCLDGLCVAVLRTDVEPGYLANPEAHLLRVSLGITNRSRKRHPGDERLQVYIVDSLHRRWYEIPGLGGVRLSSPLEASESTVSQPIFKVPSNATGLQLVLTRGHGLPNALLLGDRDSLLHPPVVVPLER